MSDELNDLKEDLNSVKNDLSESVSKFAQAPRIKEAWAEAALPAKIAGGALIAGLLWKPALLVAFGSAAYAGYKGITSYLDSEPKGPTTPTPK